MHTKTLVEIFIFNIFNDKKLKKGEKSKNLLQNLAKKQVFKVCTKMLVKCFIPRRVYKRAFLGNKTFDQRFGALKKPAFLLNFTANFFYAVFCFLAQ